MRPLRLLQKLQAHILEAVVSKLAFIFREKASLYISFESNAVCCPGIERFDTLQAKDGLRSYMDVFTRVRNALYPDGKRAVDPDSSERYGSLSFKRK